ncbi:MAG TPA: DHHA1 domain-containing protein, partial [Saprospiraceae bacterium]|nr:DHHA1 domain-containing protein [Saprospiraceae bacterium]
EKYGEFVRVVSFDQSFSTELCGGTHVSQTGNIGLFKIVSESAVAAGVRRIEAVTSAKAQEMVDAQIKILDDIKELLRNPASPVKAVHDMIEENKNFRKEIEQLQTKLAAFLKSELKSGFAQGDGFSYLVSEVNLSDAKAVKDLAYQLEKETGNTVIVFGSVNEGKPLITVIVSENLTARFHAGQMVKTLAANIKGGGGGQPFFATAGGSDASGLSNALRQAKELLTGA